jgi:4-amino-4-deoxy-L-arabinose transferase-like glycosyltransferase
MTLFASLIFFCISAIFFALFTWSYPLISPDEPRYAETAREMLSQSNFIVPYLDAVPRLVKPVLFYWLEALSFKAFGINEFAARLISILAGAGLVSLAFIFGSLNSVGIITGIITMSSIGIFIAAKLSITDMLLNFLISASLICFFVAYDQTKYRISTENNNEHKISIWLLLAFVAMAFGILTKGPIAILLPVAIISVFLFLQKHLSFFLRSFQIEIFLGILILLAINLPWYFLVDYATNGAFSQTFFLSDNLSRFFKPHSSHGAPIWFYIPVIFAGLFPWSFFLIQSLMAQNNDSSYFSLKSEKQRQKQMSNFCLVWIIITFIFFSIAKTKLPTYILPIFLPLALLIARWWQARFVISKSHNSKNLGLFWGLVAFLITVVSFLFIYFSKIKQSLSVIEANSLVLPVIIICSIYIACTAIALTSVFSKAKISFIFFASANFLCLSFFTPLLIKPFAIYRDGEAKAFMQNLKDDEKLYSYASHPSRFSFYGKRIVKKTRIKDLKELIKKDNQEIYLVLFTKLLKQFETQTQNHAIQYTTVKQNSVYTYVKISKQELQYVL